MRRSRSAVLTSSSALVAYLAMVLLAAPCSCLARASDTAPAAVCCCGPDAANPCHAPAEGQRRGGCDSRLGGCAQALPKPAAPDAPPACGSELPLSLPSAVLSLSLPEPPGLHGLRARSRAPAPLPLRLDQVRSTVLLT